MIVAVEGPSAAGKTTWCRRQAAPIVPEYVATGQEPGPGDLLARAAYWGDVNSRRWQAALDLERLHGTAVCDSDPLKLHYAWSLARIGRGAPAEVAAEARVARKAFERGALGLADLVLVRIPAPADLEQQKSTDATRRRRAFDLHRLLAEPLREWYQAVERLDPARVVWEFPDDGLAGLPAVDPRSDRSDPALLDALLAGLPPLLAR